MNEPLVSSLSVRGEERVGGRWERGRGGLSPKSKDKYSISVFSAEEAAELQKDTTVRKLFIFFFVDFCQLRRIMQCSDRFTTILSLPLVC